MEMSEIINALEEIAMYFVGCYMNAPEKSRSKEKFHSYMTAADEARRILKTTEDDGK